MTSLHSLVALIRHVDVPDESCDVHCQDAEVWGDELEVDVLCRYPEGPIDLDGRHKVPLKLRSDLLWLSLCVRHECEQMIQPSSSCIVILNGTVMTNEPCRHCWGEKKIPDHRLFSFTHLDDCEDRHEGCDERGGKHYLI